MRGLYRLLGQHSLALFSSAAHCPQAGMERDLICTSTGCAVGTRGSDGSGRGGTMPRKSNWRLAYPISRSTPLRPIRPIVRAFVRSTRNRRPTCGSGRPQGQSTGKWVKKGPQAHVSKDDPGPLHTPHGALFPRYFVHHSPDRARTAKPPKSIKKGHFEAEHESKSSPKRVPPKVILRLSGCSKRMYLPRF